MAIGYGQQRAIIRYHFKHDPQSFDEMASYWADFKYLVATEQIPMPSIPFKFKR